MKKCPVLSVSMSSTFFDSEFEGPVFLKYNHVVPSICWYFIVREFRFLLYKTQHYTRGLPSKVAFRLANSSYLMLNSAHKDDSTVEIICI